MNAIRNILVIGAPRSLRSASAAHCTWCTPMFGRYCINERKPDKPIRLVHNKGVCPRCDIKLTRDYLGVTNRRSFFCERCQIRYTPPRGRRKTPKRGFVTIARP